MGKCREAFNTFDADGSGTIDTGEMQRGGNQELEDELDTLDAFVALGGERDRSGFVDGKKLIDVVKNDFSMTIKIERVVEELDKDKDGKLNYQEFSALFL